MNIVVATDEKKVASTFSECQGYTIYEIEKREVQKSSYKINSGSSPVVIKKFLLENNVDIVIAGSAGPVAQSFFKEFGIIYILGARGKVEEVVNNYLQCELKAEKPEPVEEEKTAFDEIEEFGLKKESTSIETEESGAAESEISTNDELNKN